MKKLMKILFLNPHIDAQHKLPQALRTRGFALLMISSADDALQVLKLHGTSVDLAIIHREGIQGGDPGVELIYKIKKDPEQADLPILFTTETWTPEECASHQQTPMGANAYLHWPFDESALLKTIDAIFGSVPEAPVTGTTIEGAHPAVPQSGEFVLEELSGIYEASGSKEIQKVTDGPSAAPIQLDSPVDPSPEPSSVIEMPTASAAATPLPTPAELAAAPAPASAFPASNDAGKYAATRVITNLEELAALTGEAQEPEGLSATKTSVTVAVSDATLLRDGELARKMPYLFGKEDKTIVADPGSFARAFTQPVGDAVIPGGAANAPDTETLKKYLLLREQDVAALSAQLKAARDELAAAKSELETERARCEELTFKSDEQARKIDDFEREKELALQGVQAELEELRFQSKAKADKAKLLEGRVAEATSEIERLKERVRSDIRKIRVRERELENKLEIAKKDSEAILAARESKIIELKRKLDLLEFNMDLLQDRYAREKESSAKLREKLSKAAQVVRVAEGLLDEPRGGPADPMPTPDVESKAS